MADNIILEQCAAKLLDTCHSIMRTIGSEMGKRSDVALSIREIIAMAMIKENSNASVSCVAERLGGTISGASRMVDGLVERGFVVRETSKEDRRKLILALSEEGQHTLEKVNSMEMAYLVGLLSTLTPSECSMVNLVMDLLRRTLVAGRS